MSVVIQGLDSVLANVQQIIPNEAAKMNKRLSIAGEIVNQSVTSQASLTDHTLDQLAKMGHPYSTRYAVGNGPHGDDSLVHVQSGTLKQNIVKNENLNTGISSVEVGVSEDSVPYISDLITGTPKMRPRNFLGEGFSKVSDAVDSALGGK